MQYKYIFFLVHLIPHKQKSDLSGHGKIEIYVDHGIKWTSKCIYSYI